MADAGGPVKSMADRDMNKSSTQPQGEKKKDNDAHVDAASPSKPVLFKPLTHLTNVPKSHIGGFGVKTAPTPFAGSAASIIAPGKLVSNPFASKMPSRHSMSGTPNTSDSEDHNSSSPPSIVLRPSALSAQAKDLGKGMKSGFNSKDKADSPGNSFLLKPATLKNPFSKYLEDISHKNRDSEVTDTENSNSKTNNDNEGEVPQSEVPTGNEKQATPVDEASKENFKISGLTALPVSSPDKEAQSFVFGQKMEERAVSACDSSTNNTSSYSSDTDKNTNSSVSTNFVFGQNISERIADGVQEKSSDSEINNDSATFIFGQNLSDRVVDGKEDKSEATEKDNSSSLTLAESAKEYQAKHAQREYEEVVVKTGEEDESNVLQANCKLYMFDTAGENWVERGRGLLRLNDKNENNVLHSRIVMRTQGCLKVILNTKIWSGMRIEQASPKSLRVTAQCDDLVKVFLIMANPKDIDHLSRAIDWRIQQLKIYEEAHPQKEETTPIKGAEKRPAEKEDSISPENKRLRIDARDDSYTDPSKRRDVGQDESNDSSAVEPETEVSYGSSSSSPTIKSTSSE